MQTLLILSAATVFSGVVVFALVFRKLVSRDQVASFSVNGFIESSGDGFLAVRYRPMKHLLDENDFKFLKNQPGYTPEIGRQFRKDRRRVFRGYLQLLKNDFGQIYVAAKLLSLYSSVDQPDLVRSLIKQRMVFTYALLTIEYRLAMHSIGLATIDVHSLVESVEALQGQVRLLMTQPAAVMA